MSLLKEILDWIAMCATIVAFIILLMRSYKKLKIIYKKACATIGSFIVTIILLMKNVGKKLQIYKKEESEIKQFTELTSLKKSSIQGAIVPEIETHKIVLKEHSIQEAEVSDKQQIGTLNSRIERLESEVVSIPIINEKIKLIEKYNEYFRKDTKWFIRILIAMAIALLSLVIKILLK